MSKRQLNLMSFFKKTDKSHDATKRVRKAASGDASDQEEEASPATGDLVHSQPEWGADTAHPISHHVDPHQQPEQEASMEISASQVQQQEAGTTTSTRFFHEASEGEERAVSGEECGSSSDRSGGCATVWTAAQFKVKQSYYPWLLMDSSGLGCTICKAVGTLGPEKTGGMKLAKEWVSSTVASSSSDIKKQQRALRKKVFEHARTKAHLAAASILEKAKEDTLGQSIINSLSEQMTKTARVFRTAYKEAKRNRPAYGFEHEIDCQELNGLDMGRILHSNVACANIQKHISDEMKKKLFEKIVQCAPKLSLMLDESTSLSRRAV
ncbi:unnamed protein product [Knipowitschia caucasica]